MSGDLLTGRPSGGVDDDVVASPLLSWGCRRVHVEDVDSTSEARSTPRVMRTSPLAGPPRTRRTATRRWLVTGPLIARLVLPAMSLPLGCAAAVAITGSEGSSTWVIAAAVAISTGVRTIRNESPSRVVREMVFEAIRAGVPSGDPDIDQVVEDRLRIAAGQGRLTALLSAVLLLAIVAAPAAAAVRTSVWWLVSYAALLVLAPVFPIESWIDRPSARLRRFERILSASTTGETS